MVETKKFTKKEVTELTDVIVDSLTMIEQHENIGLEDSNNYAIQDFSKDGLGYMRPIERNIEILQKYDNIPMAHETFIKLNNVYNNVINVDYAPKKIIKK